MPAERAMTLIRIAIEPNVLRQEMLEGLQERVVPMRGPQNGAKHSFKTAIFVARDTYGLAHIVHGANSCQIRFPDCIETLPTALLDGSQLKRSSHKLVVIHP